MIAEKEITKEQLQEEQTLCHHCGDPCDDTIEHEGVFFCCYGCKAVHLLLTQSNLGDYYNETSLGNQSVSQLKAERKYAFLSNKDIQKQLLSFQNESLSVIRFSLPGIHCSSCIYLLEHLPKFNPHIVRSEINFLKKTVTISFLHKELDLKQIAVLLAQLGYPPDISLEDLDKTKKHVTKNKIGVKVAVAGFCFGNSMLMNMPEYLDKHFLLTEDFKSLFGWINLVLALPIVFYAGRDYFIKAWKGIVIKNLNIDVPIALGILTLFGRSVFEIVTKTGAGYVDSLCGLVFFLLIGKWYQGKSYQALSFERDYTSYFPVSVTCVVDGQEVDRPVKELEKGDIVVVHNDELIPADGEIVQGRGNIDYSFVTGEARPDKKGLGQKVYAGGRQKGGALLIKLDKKVASSELTQLWNADTFKKERQVLQTWVDKISHHFTLTVVLISLATGFYWWLVDPQLIWQSVTAVLIVVCPCALALVLPFAYGHAMRALGRSGLYLKNAEVVESLAKIDDIVFDKTGTLTSTTSTITYSGRSLNEEQLLLLHIALSNSSHPLSKVVLNELPSYDNLSSAVGFRRNTELSPSVLSGSDLRGLSPWQKVAIDSFVEETGKGFTARVGGHEIRVGSSLFLHVPNEEKLNESQVHIFIDRYLGHFSIRSAYRDGIFEMLKRLKNSFVLYLLSGDNDAERSKLQPYFDGLHFRQKPIDKLHFLEHHEGNHLMVGDGLNDAGALKKATVGIAISEDTHQFSPACDGILSAKDIVNLPAILRFSQSVKWIVFMAFGLSFLYNIVGLSFAMTGLLTPLVSAILMPISSVTVVGFVTLMVAWKGRRVKWVE